MSVEALRSSSLTFSRTSEHTSGKQKKKNSVTITCLSARLEGDGRGGVEVRSTKGRSGGATEDERGAH